MLRLGDAEREPMIPQQGLMGEMKNWGEGVFAGLGIYTVVFADTEIVSPRFV